MPHSLVPNLLPKSPIYPNYLTGRHLHALFLTLVNSVDKTLDDHHHASTADKAFILSPLQVNKSKHLSFLTATGKYLERLEPEVTKNIFGGGKEMYTVVSYNISEDKRRTKFTQFSNLMVSGYSTVFLNAT